MTERIYQIAKNQADKRSIDEIVIREVSSNSGFGTTIKSRDENGLTVVKSSHNTVTSDVVGNFYRIKTDTTQDIDTAIEMALKREFGENAVMGGGSDSIMNQQDNGPSERQQMDQQEEREMPDQQTENIREMPETDESPQPTRTGESNDIAAEFTLYEDGRLVVERMGESTEYETAAGLFLTPGLRGERVLGPLSLVESYVEDNFSYDQQDIQRALTDIESYLNDENR